MGLYVILLDGDYDFLRWNKALVSFGYRVDIIHLDEFERKFGMVLEIDGRNMLQDVPVNFTDGSKQPCTVYISRAFEQKIHDHFPQYIPLLEKGYVVMLKTFKKLPPRLEPTPDEVMEHLVTAFQFSKSFIHCLQLTVGSYLKPGGFFAQVIEDNAAVRDKHDRQSESSDRTDMVKKGNYFMLDFRFTMH